jgi:hypothetical protein
VEGQSVQEPANMLPPAITSATEKVRQMLERSCYNSKTTICKLYYNA